MTSASIGADDPVHLGAFNRLLPHHRDSSTNASHRSQPLSATPAALTAALTLERSDLLVTRWLEKLLQHFGIRELSESSDHRLASLVTQHCQKDWIEGNRDTNSGPDDQRPNDQSLNPDGEPFIGLTASDVDSGVDNSDRALLQAHWLQDDLLLSELKRRVVRLAGAQLSDTFVAMSPKVIDLEDVEATPMALEGKTLQRACYQGSTYRLIETFEHRHRLQAFCLAQTLDEQMSSYLITRSEEEFAVWVDIQALPRRSDAFG